MRPILLSGLVSIVAIACSSPEAERQRGAGKGADLGNRDRVIEMHEGAEPYYKTPCAMKPKECNTPQPVIARKRD